MGLTRNFSTKPRGKVARERKPVILIIAEGKNKTEKIYFDHFNCRDGKYIVRAFSSGDTDPQGLLSALKKRYSENQMSVKNGDMAFVVLDLDCSEERAEKIRTLSRKQANTNFPFIVSNPCFEIWFLNHFRYSTKEYLDPNAVITDLKEFIKDYEKNSDVFPLLKDRTQEAVTNTVRLVRHHEGKTWPSASCNPHTDVPKLISHFSQNKQII